MTYRYFALFFALALLVPASKALALGGHAIRVADVTLIEPRVSLDVTATDDGILFASCHGDSALQVLDIYRSDDGGTTWGLWSRLESQYTAGDGGEVWESEIVATLGAARQLLVLWVDRNTGDGTSSGSSIRFSAADVDAPVVTWTDTTLDTDGALALSKPRLSVRETQSGDQRVGVAWKDAGDVRYATSGDGGATWTTPLTVDTVTTASRVDVAVDRFGVVHLLVGDNDFLSDDGTLEYYRGTGNGETASDWANPIRLATVTDLFLARVSIAADPNGPGVVALGWINLEFRLVTSDDNGVTWTAERDVPDVNYPDAAWGDSGPYVGVSLGAGTFLQRGILQPVSTLDGEWAAEAITAYRGQGTSSQGALGLDPSRGGLPMVVFTQEAYVPFNDPSAEGQDLWFDAAWRDAPGYGVPIEPAPPIEAVAGAIVRAPLPGDLDGDGVLEVVFTEASSDTAHTLRWREFDAQDDAFTTDDLHPAADLALLDVDGDEDLEVVYFRPDGTVMGRHGDGSIVAGFPIDLSLGVDAGWISGSFVSGDPREDVVVAGGNAVWVIGPGGVTRAGFPFVAPGPAGDTNGRVALGDGNGDGTVELYSPFDGGVVVLDRDGQLLSVLGQGGPAPGSPSLADFDDDGDLEIAIPRVDGTVALVQSDGTSAGPQWPYDTGALGMPSQIALTDLAGDARRDLVFMAADRTVHLVTFAGFVPSGWPGPVDPATALIDPVAAVLGVADPAVAVGGADGTLQVRTAGGAQEAWPRDLATAVTAPATAADVDGNGSIDLIIPTADVLWILDMGIATVSEGAWPVSGADVGRTGWVDRPAVSTSVTSTPVARVRLDVAPNPFNPRTVLRFHLDADADALTLRVFDTKGRLVRTLHEGALTSGEHSFTWSGRTDDGREVASGVYYGRLQGAGAAAVRSMVLVR